MRPDIIIVAFTRTFRRRHFFLHNTYFEFNTNFYQQGFGFPMGFYGSPFFAETALERLENNRLVNLKNSVFFFIIKLKN